MSKKAAEIKPAGIYVSREVPTPLYMQVYEQFRQMILTKRFKSGDRLPASRDLAKELGVSRIIINKGYEELILEGYLIAKTGSGTFVADILPDHLLNVNHKVQKYKALNPIESVGPDTDNNIPIPFQKGTPSLDYFPYAVWYEVGSKVLKGLKNHYLGYIDVLGYWPLRRAISSYLRISRAVNCTPEQVIIVTGSQQGINLIVSSLLVPNDEVWMEDPGYWGARSAFKNAGVKLCPVPIEEDGLNIGYAKKNFEKAKLAYITPSHQYPLGSTLSQSKRLEILSWANETGMWILEDDYDSEFRYEGNPLASLQGLDFNKRVIYSGTFSKVLFPGLRLAYIVLPSISLLERFKKVKEIIDRQSPILEQLILTRFIDEGHFLRHLRKMRILYSERQHIMIKLLKQYLKDYFQISASPAGMHLVCYLSDKIDIDQFKKEIKKKNLMVGFISDLTLQHHLKPAVMLGYTCFPKYRMKVGIEQLSACVLNSLIDSTEGK